MKPAKRILVVEDNADLRASMQLVLDLEGYETVGAHDGGQALDIIRETPPDLIFLDMFMPGMDGWAFLDAYYQKPGRRAQIVGISGDILHPEALPGIDGFMRKPYTTEEIVTVAQNHTRQR
jgi:CheY-like chemotaxis protein